MLENRDASGFYTTYGVSKKMIGDIKNIIKKATTVLNNLSNLT